MFEYLTDFFVVEPNIWSFVSIIVLMLVCGLGLPVPEEIPLFYAGYLAYREVIPIQFAILWCVLALFIGDSTLFFMGYSFGQKILDWPWFKKALPPKIMKKVNFYLKKYGSGVVFVARFLPGIRGPVFLMTGILRMDFKKFILFDGLAALLSAPLLMWVAYKVCIFFSGEIHQAIHAVRKTERIILAVAIVGAIAVFTYLHKRQKKSEKLDTVKNSETPNS